MDVKSQRKLNLCVLYDGVHHATFRHFLQKQMNFLRGDNVRLSVCGLTTASQPLKILI